MRMKTRLVVGALGAAVMAALGCWSWHVWAQAAPSVRWIWYDEVPPHADAPAETRCFRRVFHINRDVPRPVDEATLDITADNSFTVWVNGALVGSGNDWKVVRRFDVSKLLVHGRNVIAVEAHNDGGPGGLLVRLAYLPNGMSKMALVSDRAWRASTSAPAGWQKSAFDDSRWSRARELAPLGGGPWQGLAWGDRGRSANDRFSVPEGFRVEEAVRTPAGDPTFSLINMTFDARGRLLVSREGGAVLLCTDPDDKGVFRSVRPYCTKVTGCQGMCWVGDALMLVGDGPAGTGLYRCRDTRGRDRIDEVRLLHRFQGSMGEHGPHAVLHGPDGCLYVVIGNHAHARMGRGAAPNPERLAANSPLTRWPTGLMGPDQGKPGSTEDVLLPRQNDARGHAADILAPGGTIWRLDHNGRNMALVAAGFRNHFDAAFNPAAELFTFDSDMEWDEGLPWYRAVRICHCPPGADFVWRTGAANTPSYYIDSLPPLYETGRGSPVGLEFYDHHAFPEKYRGAYFMGDWSLGVIWAVRLQRDGAKYRARDVEKFCQGAPMNVTDLAVGPDGALYFVMGGRGTQGGVFRIVWGGTKSVPTAHDILDGPQPLAAWSRAPRARSIRDPEVMHSLATAAADTSLSPARRVKAVMLLSDELWDGPPSPAVSVLRRIRAGVVSRLMHDRDADVRAAAVWRLGFREDFGGADDEQARQGILAALQDEDPFVRRRACEALIRRGTEPPVEAVWPLLADKDRFLRTAARLVIQRIDPVKWATLVWTEGKGSDLQALEGIVALCKTDQAAANAGPIFERLRAVRTGSAAEVLDWLRTTQLALLHTKDRPGTVREIVRRCLELFPQADARVNRELAILLTDFRKEGLTEAPVHARLLDALKASAGDRAQQIHYLYCLRLLHDGWRPDQKAELLAWYEGTKAWQGGASFTPFLENILHDAAGVFSTRDMDRLASQGERYPLATGVLLRVVPESQLPPVATLWRLYARLVRAPDRPELPRLKSDVVDALARQSSPQAQRALRAVADVDPGEREAVARSLLRFPRGENFPYLVRGLDTSNKLLIADLIDVLKRTPSRPRADDPAPYRLLLLAAGRLNPRQRWAAVELFRHWTGGRQFGADDGDWKTELQAWARWFAQAFPREPALPDVASDQPTPSRYRFDELLSFLHGPGRTGNSARGRVVFDKALCLKCHKYGREGEGVGPDLTTVSKRFKRADILESIVYPSKVISDQYRSTQIITKKGQQLNGLVAARGDVVTVLLNDGSKVTLRKDEIEQQFASLVSVMPEKLLDPLSKQEIADLFAFLESEPK
jgi:putative heme-binding domain-containing protein